MTTLYSAADVSLTLDGVDIPGLIDGDAITIELREDNSDAKQGLREATLFAKPSLIADVTIKILQGSPSLDVMMGILQPLITDRTGVTNLQLVDNFGTTRFSSSSTRPMRLPPINISTEPGDVEFKLVSVIDEHYVGGNTQT